MMLQTVEQAHDKAAALGKALYSQLFLWLVAKLNTTISAPQRLVYTSYGRNFVGALFECKYELPAVASRYAEE